MCGFAAFLEPGRAFAPDLLDAVDADLAHRGPDGAGRLVEPGIALVFRRLAILDPSPAADQPMTDAAAGLSLIFNGEIYNYRALREELAAAGVRFRSRGDSEVVLAGYARWGEGVLDRLEGMYALVLIDRRRGLAIAARDPFAIKPLYWARAGAATLFASTMRPLRRVVGTRLDANALAELLTFGFAATPLSNLDGIERLPGGTLVRVPLAGGPIVTRRFHDVVEDLAGARDGSKTEALAQAIEGSVLAHLASDVGYALQLSGGVDSGLVAAHAARHAAAPIASFAVDLAPSPHDEGAFRAPIVARLGLDHAEVPVDGRNFADALPRAVAHMEGPLPHMGCAALMLVCEGVRQRSKVVLTGEGADEMFGGYRRYARWRQLALQERMARALPGGVLPDRPPFMGVRHLIGRDAAVDAGIHVDAAALRRLFPGLALRPGLREAASGRFPDMRRRLLAVDRAAYLESLLLRQDKMAMAASVEARVPFVHAPLARVIDRVPLRRLIPGGTTKPLLKAIAARHLPPDAVHRPKVGLTLPFDDWLADDGALGRYLDDIASPAARIAAFGEAAGIRAGVEAFRSGRRGGLGLQLVRLINLETWLRGLDATPAP
jgi:asparagine synthase (glutamine-hydrolysing)